MTTVSKYRPADIVIKDPEKDLLLQTGGHDVITVRSTSRRVGIPVEYWFEGTHKALRNIGFKF